MCTKKWYKLHCLNNKIQLQTTLTGGQSFRLGSVQYLNSNQYLIKFLY